MKLSIAKLKDRLVQKFIRDPAGYGRPVPVEALDAEYREGHWDHFFSADELPRNLVLAGLVDLYCPGGSILDVGCGSGRLATVLQRYPFSRYLGIDVSAEGLDKARALGLARAQFAQGNYETWRPAETYDAIVFNECIGYAQDPAATLAAFLPYLGANGRFFLSHFRFGTYAAQWRRMATVCETEFATAVTSDKGQTWDVKVLRPRTRAARGLGPR